MIRRLLTTKEAAAQLGVTETFLVKDRLCGGGIPFVRLGHRSIRYKQDDINNHIEAHTYTSTSEYGPTKQALSA